MLSAILSTLAYPFIVWWVRRKALDFFDTPRVGLLVFFMATLLDLVLAWGISVVHHAL